MVEPLSLLPSLSLFMDLSSLEKTSLHLDKDELSSLEKTSFHLDKDKSSSYLLLNKSTRPSTWLRRLESMVMFGINVEAMLEGDKKRQI